MAIFSKPISQLVSSDLQELVTDRAVENIRLEFKSEIPKKDEALKKLSSFANTFGGYLIIGARADSSDGRLIDFPGVELQPGIKQRLVQWCFDAISPPLLIEVSDPIPLPSVSDRVGYVVYVAESDLGPYFLNGRKGVYIRTDEFSQRFEPQLATEAELRQLFDRRKLVLARRDEIVHRASGRFRTFIDARYSELLGNNSSIGARFELSIVPRYPSRQVWAQSDLLNLLNSKRLSWRQVRFPSERPGENLGLVSQHESVIVLWPGTSFSILEANVWGLLFYASEIERKTDAYMGIHLNHFLGQLLVFLGHACLMIRETGLTGPLEITMSLEAIRAVLWVYFEDTVPQAGSFSPLDDSVAFTVSTFAEELVRRRDSIAMDLLAYVFFALNWPTMAQSRQGLAKMVRVGYAYNLWDIPSALRE